MKPLFWCSKLTGIANCRTKYKFAKYNLNFQNILQDHRLIGELLLSLWFAVSRDSAGAELHSNRDCFGLAVLSHGEAGLLHGVDESISITNLIAPIKNCGSLAGKPKLFFFQVLTL